MSEYHKPDTNNLQELRDIANKLRVHSIRSTSASNSGWVSKEIGSLLKEKRIISITIAAGRRGGVAAALPRGLILHKFIANYYYSVIKKFTAKVGN